METLNMRSTIIKSIILKFIVIIFSFAVASNLVSFAAMKSSASQGNSNDLYKIIFDYEITVYAISLFLCLIVLETLEKKHLQRKFDIF